MELLRTIFYYPLLNLLIFLYGFLGSFGVAIIVVTIMVRLFLFYFAKHSIVAQKRMSELQPELKKIQEKHKNNKEDQTRAVMEFYKNNKVNPFSGCLPMLIQIPILLSLYYVFLKGIDFTHIQGLYSFVAAPENIDFYFLGIFDLSSPSKVFAVLAGGSQFLQSKIMLKMQKPISIGNSGEFSSVLNSQMSLMTLYFVPAMTFFFSLQFPSGLALYWIIGAIFSIIQQIIIEKYYLPQNKSIVIDGKSA